MNTENKPTDMSEESENNLTSSKTPFFKAMHNARYQRQSIIKKIQEKYGRKLICYISCKAGINRDDTIGFVDLLHNVHKENLDLMIHTPGGDIDAAEKLINMTQTVVPIENELRVIIPDFAKSAGTLMAIGADKIIMSDTSELGPIDPQITLNDGHGNLIPQSVQFCLDAYETHSIALQKNPNDPVAKMMLNKLDPIRIKQFENVRDRAQKFAEDQLKYRMFRITPGNFTKIAKELIDTKRWMTHGQMISCDAAKNMGINVDYLEPGCEEWQSYWQLYCMQRLAIDGEQKLFESDYVSIKCKAAIIRRCKQGVYKL